VEGFRDLGSISLQVFGRPYGALTFIFGFSQDCILAFGSDSILGYYRSLPPGAFAAARFQIRKFLRGQ
jgi:hypothetical protein